LRDVNVRDVGNGDKADNFVDVDDINANYLDNFDIVLVMKF